MEEEEGEEEAEQEYLTEEDDASKDTGSGSSSSSSSSSGGVGVQSIGAPLVDGRLRGYKRNGGLRSAPRCRLGGLRRDHEFQ